MDVEDVRAHGRFLREAPGQLAGDYQQRRRGAQLRLLEIDRDVEPNRDLVGAR